MKFFWIRLFKKVTQLNSSSSLTLEKESKHKTEPNIPQEIKLKESYDKDHNIKWVRENAKEKRCNLI